MQETVADFERSTILHGATVEGIRIEPSRWIGIDFITPRRFAVFFTSTVLFRMNCSLVSCHVNSWSVSQGSKFLQDSRESLVARFHEPSTGNLLHFRLSFHDDQKLDVIAEDFHFVICERQSFLANA
jgi:hypothetical protein